MGAGIRRVRYGDTEMEYFSIAEMQAARSALVNDLAVAGGTHVPHAFAGPLPVIRPQAALDSGMQEGRLRRWPGSKRTATEEIIRDAGVTVGRCRDAIRKPASSRVRASTTRLPESDCLRTGGTGRTSRTQTAAPTSTASSALRPESLWPPARHSSAAGGGARRTASSCRSKSSASHQSNSRCG